MTNPTNYFPSENFAEDLGFRQPLRPTPSFKPQTRIAARELLPSGCVLFTLPLQLPPSSSESREAV